MPHANEPVALTSILSLEGEGNRGREYLGNQGRRPYPKRQVRVLSLPECCIVFGTRRDFAKWSQLAALPTRRIAESLNLSRNKNTNHLSGRDSFVLLRACRLPTGSFHRF
jgi:hypothetical protein